ncbi:MAG: hypothetical protein P8047_17945 [Gammaproteobacteria bacterium]|jgi:hypothetical protein
MSRTSYLALALGLQLIFAGPVHAQNFEWLNNLAVEARADPSGFTARLATRFHIGNAEVQAVIDNVGGNQADAYMVMRLAEMSHRPIAYVTERYHKDRRRGWGVLARNLGIKPGSRAFHALKAGPDLGGHRSGAGRGKAGAHGNGHGRGHGNGGKGRHGRGND